MELIDALKQLDKSDDDSWTSDGQPRLEVLKKILGRSVGRSDIAAAVQGFSRSYDFDAVIDEPTPVDQAASPAQAKPDESEKQRLQSDLDAAQAGMVKAEKAFIAAQAAMDAYIIDNQGACLSHAEQVKAYQKASAKQAAIDLEFKKATAKLIQSTK